MFCYLMRIRLLRGCNKLPAFFFIIFIMVMLNSLILTYYGQLKLIIHYVFFKHQDSNSCGCMSSTHVLFFDLTTVFSLRNLSLLSMRRRWTLPGGRIYQQPKRSEDMFDHNVFLIHGLKKCYCICYNFNFILKTHDIF